MARATDRAAVEAFHVALLGELRLPHGQYAVKGGLNLRLFYGSPRLSEDLDIDVDARAPAPGTLRKTVDRALAGQGLRRRLAHGGVAIQTVTRPKQTDTVQRWKVALDSKGQPLHTKVEFSRRGLEDGIEVGFLAPDVAVRHPMVAPVPLAHYGVQAAFQQKIGALVGRAEPQARDVFDLHLLLQRGAGHSELDEQVRERAIERLMSMGFASFRAQVLSFLTPEDAVAYESESVWDAMVLRVVDALESGAAR